LNVYELQPRFASLFDGLDIAFGTGRGEWVKRPLTKEDWVKHLQGHGPGIGVAPLRKDNTVAFAAIDLDEPDFDAAREMQEYIPGTSWLERSRSGNAHVWVFFSDPCPAWLAMGVLKEATLAAGKDHVEVFPKNHDFARVRLGNYINLPYHGDCRPILFADEGTLCDMDVEDFLDAAEATKNDPKDWHKRAALMLIAPPNEREKKANFGEAKTLHICAEHLIQNMEDNPVLEGHRAVVYFNLAKALTNWTELDHDEALEIIREVNAASPDTIEDRELQRILGNAERGQFTSTGCDDPLFAPYAHPDCPIAHPRSR
jgi:diadenosine tetraphosphate (Ap4A) HIT family hydrolase